MPPIKWIIQRIWFPSFNLQCHLNLGLNRGNAMCRWRIRIESQSRSKIVQIRTVDMNLPIHENNCTGSYIKAYDGQYNSAPLLKTWCDDSTIFSTGAYVIVEFHGGHVSSRGFALSFHEVDMFSHKCKSGEIQKIDVTQTPLVVTIPDEDAFRKGNEDCQWLFTSNKMYSKVVVELDEWVINSPDDFCNQSYISFHDGDGSESLEILKYCHSDQPFHKLVTSSDMLYIHLHGNWSRAATKLPSITLKLHSTKIKNPVVDCHTSLQTTVVGDTPSFIVYPTGDLTTEEELCPLQLWSKDRSKTVRVDIVGSSEGNVSCQDYLQAYNDLGDVEEIQYTCLYDKPAYMNPHRMQIQNTTNDGRVVLKAYTVGRPCDGITLEKWAENDKKKSLEILGIKDSYVNNGYCKYLLMSEQEDEKIKLFVNGSFYDDDNVDTECEKDFVALYDGDNEKSPMIAKWCGGSVPDGFHSTGQQMLVIFKSDHQGRQHKNNYDLQYIAYKEMCSRFTIPLNATSSKQNLSSPGFPDYYPPDSLCSWSIRPSSENHYIVFQLLKTHLGPHCRSLLTAYQSNEDSEHSTIDRACEDETPTLKSSAGAMEIEFRSDSFWNVGGFLAEFWEEPIPEPKSEPKSEPEYETNPKSEPNSEPRVDSVEDKPKGGCVKVTVYSIYVYCLLTLFHYFS
ncbi:hypothetical protein LOTGIDRAFT_231910 [Lottia gigantea]|uniref:CUB domain-containing protein n=1 Tax=Lottia gigantea TaxID=225164 RepID=V4C2F1_LOTGI|nr:hypothetical protein LOTGIDRAFT_231910 [Lottia gigantea]ESO95684.1 hypothetical protein LOTGIDRAFT_231910 [Lottia gigantea]